MNRRLAAGILCILMSLMLFGCKHKHIWIDATCTTPKTCEKCGETEGKPTAHTWLEATCTAPKTCSVCGATEGEPIAHTWLDATCTEPKICSVCGATEGEPLGHNWKDATCTKPKTCSVCGATDGEPLGHSWQDATCTMPRVCSVCGAKTGSPLGHKVEEWTTEKEPSCAEQGIEAGICSVCGEKIERGLGKLEHTPGDWITVSEATWKDAGVRVIKCTVCGEELKRETYQLSDAEKKESYKRACKTIAYDSLARTPDTYKGELVKFSGYVVQALDASSALEYSVYRVATSGRYNNVVYVLVDNYGSGTRILEDDYITFYGVYDGVYTYKTIMGGSVTIPKVTAKYVE